MKSRKELRSRQWYGGNSKSAFMHRSWMKNQGMPEDEFDGRPVIGICNTWSEMTPCNAHLRDLAERVKFGVYEAGGFPVEFPVLSASESQTRPTAMLHRNLAAMDVEECIRAYPVDGVVLMAGCDKTTPSLVMGAASCDIPAIVVSGGPMLNGVVKGEKVGSGTAVFRWVEELKAGTMSEADFLAAEAGHSRSAGSCMTMGTASTMASMVEALGLRIPSGDSRSLAIASLIAPVIDFPQSLVPRAEHILGPHALGPAIASPDRIAGLRKCRHEAGAAEAADRLAGVLRGSVQREIDIFQNLRSHPDTVVLVGHPRYDRAFRFATKNASAELARDRNVDVLGAPVDGVLDQLAVKACGPVLVGPVALSDEEAPVGSDLRNRADDIAVAHDAPLVHQVHDDRARSHGAQTIHPDDHGF